MGISVSSSMAVEEMQRMSRNRKEEKKKKIRQELARDIQPIQWKDHHKENLYEEIPVIRVQKPFQKPKNQSIHDDKSFLVQQTPKKNERVQYDLESDSEYRKNRDENSEVSLTPISVKKPSKEGVNQDNVSFQEQQSQITKHQNKNMIKKSTVEVKQATKTNISIKKIKNAPQSLDVIKRQARPSIEHLAFANHSILQQQNKQSNKENKKVNKPTISTPNITIKQPHKSQFDIFDWSIPLEEDTIESQLLRRQQIPSKTLVLSNKFNENMMHIFEKQEKDEDMRQKLLRASLQSSKGGHRKMPSAVS